VLVDYNQNAWGRTLASIYSVRPKPLAPVSTPVTWEEVESEIEVEDFTLKNVPARVRKLGDLWKPLLQDKGKRGDDSRKEETDGCAFDDNIAAKAQIVTLQKQHDFESFAIKRSESE
jgi:DNA primase